MIYDPAITTLSKRVVVQCVRKCRRNTPVIVADDLRSLGERALLALRTLSS